ncbi:Hypothetical predicted protein [Olea europaea subsp. europaea]|uniref:Uncharacterized protein n=1 Tax=Olea europaea subsp. europaea TaxID=158383 RepID=A0A8S0PPR6_OLEEU|nr:Hypothetical predicted protein [Olea europaea subsp. europaea]
MEWTVDGLDFGVGQKLYRGECSRHLGHRDRSSHAVVVVHRRATSLRRSEKENGVMVKWYVGGEVEWVEEMKCTVQIIIVIMWEFGSWEIETNARCYAAFYIVGFMFQI